MDTRYDKLRERVVRTEQLRVRTLMIQGGADACDPPSESQAQEQFLPAGYRREVQEGVGHFPAREAADQVAVLVLDSLAPA